MTDDHNPQPPWAMNRRTLMSLIGMAVAAATVDACSSDDTASGTTHTIDSASSAPPATSSTTSSTTPISATSPSTPTSSSEPSASSPVTPTTDAATTEVATTGEATTTSAASRKSLALAYPVPVDAARLQDLADRYNGEWTGNWAEESGGSGEVHATITIDATTRTVSGMFSYTGPLLQGGAGTPELLELTIPDGTTPENFDATSDATGDVVYTYEGGTTASLSAGSLPGNESALRADLSLSGDSASASYTVVSAGGQRVLGAGVVARNRVPDLIDLASIKASQLSASINSGEYAADLLTVDEVNAAIGAPVTALIPNGGRVGYQVGVQASNVRALTADGNLIVQITVYRADDAATAFTFWVNGGYPRLGPSVPGYGSAAVEYGVYFGVLAGNLIAEIEVLAVDGNFPIDRTTAQHNLAAAMIPRMLTAP